MSKNFDYLTGNAEHDELVNRWMDKMEEWVLGLRNDLVNQVRVLQDQIDALDPEPTPVTYSAIIGTDDGTFVGTDGGGMVGEGL